MSLNVEIKSNIHNRFDIFKENVKTGKKEQVGYAENIVLDAMWPRLCGGSTYFVNIHYGTGTGTLSPARTSLFSHLGTGAASTVETVRAIPTSYWRRSITLGLTTANGNTLTEVGIAYGTGSTNLVTHAQIRDMNGNPTGIVKTDTDIITIYATVYITLINDHASIKLCHPASNGLLSYLLGDSFPSAVFSAGSGFASSNNPPGLISYAVGSSGTGSWSSDVPNKKRVSSLMRFETTVNGHIRELAFSNIAHLNLPASGIYSGLDLSDVPIGTGDGETDTFDLPSAFVDENSIVIKVDSVTAPVTLSNDYKYISRQLSVYNPAFISDDRTYLVAVNLRTSPCTFFDIYKKSNDQYDHVNTFNKQGDSGVKGGCFLRNNTLLVCADNEPLYIVDLLTYQEKTLNVEISGFPYYDSDEKILYMIDNGVVNMYSVSELDELTLLASPTHSASSSLKVNSASLSPDKTEFIFGGYISSGTRLIRLVKNEGVWTQQTIPNPAYTVSGVDFSYDGLYALIYVGNNNAPFDLYKKSEGSWSKVTSYSSSNVGYGVVGMFLPDRHTCVLFTDTYYVSNRVSLKTFDILNDAFVEAEDVVWLKFYLADARTSYGGFSADKRSIFGNNAVYEYEECLTKITFSTPPADGAVITADYTVNGIHKTAQRVIDISGEIQFGEPT